ncbi:MAG: hypothetical protein HFI35_08960 [Roseburia sp.]|nr:hypothetical protein [Roseburia sp.]
MKKEQWVIVAAFLTGIILANLAEKELFVTSGIFNGYYLHQYSYRMIDGNRLFCHILLERGKAALFIFLLGQTLGGRVFSVLMQGLIGLTFGFLAVASIVNLGARGILIAVGGLFPQWMFYLTGIVYYINCRREPYEVLTAGSRAGIFSMHLTRLFFLLGVLLTGIIAESYVNPLLFEYLAKLF